MFENQDIKGLRQDVDLLGEGISQLKEVIENNQALLMNKLEALEEWINTEKDRVETAVSNAEYEDDDELYEEAKKIVIEVGRASTSYLQRMLGIGYARAAKLMDMLEENEIIEPADGAKPRLVIFKVDDVSDN